MSCKIYDGGSPVTPFAWPSIQSREAKRASTPARAQDETTSSSAALEKHIAQLNAQAESRIAQARETGYAEGQRAARAELQPVLERLSKTLEGLSAMRAELRKQAEQDLVKLTIAIARRVLRRELMVDSDALQGIVVAALDRLQVREVSRVRIHPDHEAAVRRYLQAAGAQAIEVAADNSLNPGDVVFDTSRGTFEGSIDSQLREIERGFADAMPR